MSDNKQKQPIIQTKTKTLNVLTNYFNKTTTNTKRKHITCNKQRNDQRNDCTESGHDITKYITISTDTLNLYIHPTIERGYVPTMHDIIIEAANFNDNIRDNKSIDAHNIHIHTRLSPLTFFLVVAKTSGYINKLTFYMTFTIDYTNNVIIDNDTKKHDILLTEEYKTLSDSIYGDKNKIFALLSAYSNRQNPEYNKNNHISMMPYIKIDTFKEYTIIIISRKKRITLSGAKRALGYGLSEKKLEIFKNKILFII